MKAVFFDADGTICDIKKGVQRSVADAIRQLRKNGHLAFLCTGRCRALVTNDIADIGFDGIIAACGTYIELDSKIVLNHMLLPEMAKKCVEILRECDLFPVLEGPEYMYFDQDEDSGKVDWFSDFIALKLGRKLLPIKENENNLRINKISAKIKPGSDHEKACRLLAADLTPIYHRAGAPVGSTIELVPCGFSKGTGLRTVAKAYGIPISDTIAFGDSNNDIAMFEAAGYGVAMAGAPDPLLALTDIVTPSLEEDGIPIGLHRLGLI